MLCPFSHAISATSHSGARHHLFEPAAGLTTPQSRDWFRRSPRSPRALLSEVRFGSLCVRSPFFRTTSCSVEPPSSRASQGLPRHHPTRPRRVARSAPSAAGGWGPRALPRLRSAFVPSEAQPSRGTPRHPRSQDTRLPGHMDCESTNHLQIPFGNMSCESTRLLLPRCGRLC